jgi:hypothetical protein
MEGAAKLRFEPAGASALLTGRGLADGMYELYFRFQSEPEPMHVGFLSVMNNEFSIHVTDLRSWDNINEVILLTFTEGAVFSHPTYPKNK